jgi:8-oxo-dGTP pyrophosphatase MutT (NUDIX family)
MFEECLVREFLEETGLHVTCEGLLTAYPFEVTPDAWINVLVYRCELTATNERMRTSHEHSSISFVQPREIPDQELPAGYRRAIDLAKAQAPSRSAH